MKVLSSFIIAALAFAAIVGWVLYVTSIKICNFCAQPITETEVVEDIWAADSTPKPYLIQQMLTNAEASEFVVNPEATAIDKFVELLESIQDDVTTIKEEIIIQRAIREVRLQQMRLELNRTK